VIPSPWSKCSIAVSVFLTIISPGRSTLSSCLAENFLVFAVKRVEGQDRTEVSSEHTTRTKSGSECLRTAGVPKCESRARDKIGYRRNI
jgi:hypothetical protein